ncbi:MAG: hypothetical protein Q7R87_00780 [Nanoarchaeota archaeon]|nr:hypothetical protein [Nanoarchaeota archaeon]
MFRSLIQRSYKVFSRNFIYSYLYKIESLRKLKHLISNSNLSPEFPLHGDPIAIESFKLLVKSYKIDCIIETGTYKGFTTSFFARAFPEIPIYTCEIDDFNYRTARENLKEYGNVQIFKESSPKFIESLIKDNKIGKRPFFYLDAHWFNEWPLESELNIIFNKLKSAIVLIDDFKVPDNVNFAFDKYHNKECSLDRVMPNLNKNNKYNILFPKYGKEVLKERRKYQDLVGYALIFQNLNKDFNKLLGNNIINKFYKDKSNLLRR